MNPTDEVIQGLLEVYQEFNRIGTTDPEVREYYNQLQNNITLAIRYIRRNE